MSIRVFSGLSKPLCSPAFSRARESLLSKKIPFTPFVPNQAIHTKTPNGDDGPKHSHEKRFPKYLLGAAIGTGAALVAYQAYKMKQRGELEDLLDGLRTDQRSSSSTRSRPEGHSTKTDELEMIELNELIQPKISDKDLHALGGNAEILDRVSDVVRYLQNPKEFTRSGVKPPKGLILSGPPGVGKTLLAEAIAGHAGVPLILISGAEFASPLVGQSEKKMRFLFKKAEEMAPCVICIDEIDSVGAKRFSSSNDPHWANSRVNQMLTLLSQNHPGVIVIATTNHYDQLDPSLVRPGRFDRHISLSLPNQADRERILEIYTKDKKLSGDVVIKDFAALSGGFSGAQLAAWVNEAAICATREKSSEINGRHFEAARTLISTGVTRKSELDPKYKSLTAAHEAGHALVGHMLNQKLHKISIRQHNDSLGVTEWIAGDGSLRTREEVLDWICIQLAGRAAELISGTPQMGSKSDLDKAKALAVKMVAEEALGSSITGSPSDVEQILQAQMDRAHILLQEHRQTWEKIRDTLIERDELLREDFLKVVAGKNLSSNNWLFYSQPKSAAEVSLPLPPKRKFSGSLKMSPGKFEKIGLEKREYLPFSLDEVAKVLGVETSSIRKITGSSKHGFEVVFKPAFTQHDHMRSVSKDLKNNNVENLYSGGYSSDSTACLHIWPDGADDFIRYVNEKV